MAVFVEIVSTGSLTTEAEHGRQAFECVSAGKKVALAAGKAGSTIRRSVVQPVRPVRQGAQQVGSYRFVRKNGSPGETVTS